MTLRRPNRYFIESAKEAPAFNRETLAMILDRLKPAKFYEEQDWVYDEKSNTLTARGRLGKGKKKTGTYFVSFKVEPANPRTGSSKYTVKAGWDENGKSDRFEKTYAPTAYRALSKGVGDLFDGWRWSK